VGVAGLSAGLRSGAPVPDAFYEPPQPLAQLQADPGDVLRVEPFTRAIPAGAQAWRVLYATTRADDEPAVASAIVVVPRAADGGPLAEPPPVILWHHGTTGVAEGCAPSVLDDVWGSGAFYLLDDVLAQGWALVAPDYVGLGTAGPHPYLVGEPTARSALDAARAVQQLDEVDVADATVAWGHSQGGGAALWSGVLASTYAPDVDLVGVAALAPASNLPGLVANLGEIPGGSIFASFVVDGYVNSYPDVRIGDVVTPQTQTLTEEFAARCLSGGRVLVSALESLLVRDALIREDSLDGPFGRRLQENVPTGDITVPLFIGQGAADGLVLPTAQRAYVEARCAAGQDLEYREYEGRDHVPLVEADSPLVPDLLAWTQARLADEPALSTCAAR
jgi:alpha-beta hydrolase superfamily lysophospholipase